MKNWIVPKKNKNKNKKRDTELDNKKQPESSFL